MWLPRRGSDTSRNGGLEAGGGEGSIGIAFAACRCRVSTRDQSCEPQERDLAAFAVRASLEGVAVHAEVASEVLHDRRERARVLSLVQARDTRDVLIAELSRWGGRGAADLLATLHELKARRMSLVALGGMAFDPATHHGRMTATLFDGIAEFERELDGRPT